MLMGGGDPNNKVQKQKKQKNDDTMTNRLEDKNLGDRPQYPVAGRPLEPNFQKNFLFEI